MGMNNAQAPVATGGMPDLPEHKQKAMMESYAKFYGEDDNPKVAKLSYNKLYQASRQEQPNANPMSGIPAEMRNDPAFKQAQKKFFQNEVSDTASQYNAAASKFFDGGNQGPINPEKTLGDKF